MLKQEIRKKVWQEPYFFLAFGFGSGLAKFAPGTFGTIAGIPIYLLMSKLGFSSYLFITVLLFGFGVYICDKVGSELGEDDYPGIVWDEIVGFLITMLTIPTSFTAIILGFLVFRFFDILKIWPISYVERRVKGGMGVMLDDVLAGVFALLVCNLILILF